MVGEGGHGGPADQYLDSLYVKIYSDKKNPTKVCAPQETPIEVK
jgi:hypothetical protein